MELTTVQAAAALGLSVQAVRNHVASGRLPARRHGVRQYYRFREADLREFSIRYAYPLVEGVEESRTVGEMQTA